ncbi:something about silencing protein 10 [Fopius arisanus]|uniref:Something about silencing protein 10 n=1 Tax=Fopius arisanus TaxID=64838 RepID=A0A9R1T320_9HYME|nr:PREDICTED: something about silencing protein 10 [Fopius arisanus]
MGPKKKTKKDFKEFETFEDDDITNSEDEYSEGELELLEKVRKKRVQENFDSDDEVLGLHNDEDDDSMESDIERPQEEDDLPDERAWGKRKRTYYMTDYVDQDYAGTNDKDMEQAELEEKEARNIQQRLAQQLDDADFGLEGMQLPEAQDKPDDELVKTDFSKLTKREKLALVNKESPEFEALVCDFKERMNEAKDILSPFLKLAEEENWPDCPALNFLRTKYQLILNYCVNINFYLVLKAKKIAIVDHPVIKRLAQYRQLMAQLEEGQGKILEEAVKILQAKREGRVLHNVVDSSKTLQRERKKLNDIPEDVEGEEGGLDASEDDEAMEEAVGDDGVEEDVALDDGKRPINYQIAKNKGLTPHRKKEQRNPRVKHRNKYRKAKIRRKGAVREVRKELTRYAGELSGIKASVKKSIKIK